MQQMIIIYLFVSFFLLVVAFLKEKILVSVSVMN